MKSILRYFTKSEWILWGVSVFFIISSFIVFSKDGLITLTASLLGVTAIIINAKGNPAGQAMMVVFGIMYSIISYKTAYYGELATYAGMTSPMALFSFISWVKNPYRKNKAEVKINTISRKEVYFMFVLSVPVTAVFFFILRYFGTARLLVSTLSVTTSFIAVYLTFRRTIYFSLAYALNDIVLIVLWGLASFCDTSCISVLICFVSFLANDIYGFISWKKMLKRQKSGIL